MNNETNLKNAVNTGDFERREKMLSALFSVFLIALVLSPIIEPFCKLPAKDKTSESVLKKL